MPAAGKRATKNRKSRHLLDSLEQRLDLLTRTLNEADISEKSIDIVKKIKELHTILRSLREAEAPDQPQQLMVVWGGPQMPGGSCGSSSGSGPLAEFAARTAPSTSGRADRRVRNTRNTKAEAKPG